jgi:hypothetical protein
MRADCLTVPPNIALLRLDVPAILVKFACSASGAIRSAAIKALTMGSDSSSAIVGSE